MKHTVYLLGFLFLTACGQKPKMTPVEYNDAIIGEQTKISRVMIDMANYFAIDLDKSDQLRQDLVEQCKLSIEAVKKLPDYKGDTRFRDAGVALFTFYKEISEKEYKEMIDVLRKEEIEEADIKLLEALELKIGAREEPLDAEFQAAQKAFAEKHKLSLYENEIQKEIDDLGK
jgi:hypothetical protein